MTHMVDNRVARRRHQPGFWILWHAVLRPCRESFDQRVAECVFGASHVARVRRKVCHQAPVGLSRHPLDSSVSGPVSTLLTASTHPVTRCRYSDETGRTSTAPIEAAGQRAAQSSAASSEGSSRIVNPPSCSLVSANGPSCTRRFPSFRRTVVPVSGGCSGLPPT